MSEEHVHVDPEPPANIEQDDVDVPDAAKHLAGMDACVLRINEALADEMQHVPEQGLKGYVTDNVAYLESMTGPKVHLLGDSPDLSTYETAITAGNAYVAA